MATQGQGGVSVRFEQTGVEEMQKSIDGLNETIQLLAKHVAQLSSGEKELTTTTQELNRVQNQVSVSSGLGDNALRRQLVSVSRLQGGIAALVPQLGSTSYAFRRVAIAAGGLLTINPLFATLAGAVAAVGLAVNHLQENARKAREEMEKLANVRIQRENLEWDTERSGISAKYEARWAVQHEGKGNEYLDEENAKSQKNIDILDEQIADRKKELDARSGYISAMKKAGENLLNNRPDNVDDLQEWNKQRREYIQKYFKEATGSEWSGVMRTGEGVDLAKKQIEKIVAYATRETGYLADRTAKVSEQNYNDELKIGEERARINANNADDIRKQATKNDEANEKQAERDRQSDLKAERDREIERQVQNAARVEQAGEARQWRQPLDLTQSDEDLQRLIDNLRKTIRTDNDELDRIEALRANTGKISDENMKKYSEASQEISYAQAKLNEALGEQTRRASMVEQPINPFEGFSATQTDLESHGADIGAGVGGSSIDDRLQKMSAYLQQIAENTKVTEPATMTQ